MHNRGHTLIAFPAMIFVGASWGANVPVSKVMLAHFDLIPMSAIRTAVAGAALGLLLLLVEGAKALRIDLDFRRFALLGLMMGGFFAVYTLGLQFSNPITAAAVAVAGPLVSAVTVRLVTGLRFDPGFPVALALTLLGGAILCRRPLVGSGSVTFGGGEIVVLLSNSIWTLYSIKAQAWFDRASQLHRAYVASLSAFGWTTLLSVVLIALGWSRSPLAVTRRLGMDPAPGHRLACERRSAAISGTSAPAGSAWRWRRCGSIWCRFSPYCGPWPMVSCPMPTRSWAASWR